MTDNLLDKLNDQIREELELCNADNTPTICRAISSSQGYVLVQDLIVKKVIAGSTIGDAIVAIDNEFDLNSLD